MFIVEDEVLLDCRFGFFLVVDFRVFIGYFFGDKRYVDYWFLGKSLW